MAADSRWRRGHSAAAVVVGLNWKKDCPVGVVAAAGLNWKTGYLAEAFLTFQTCYFAVAAAAAAVAAGPSARIYYSAGAVVVAALVGLGFQAFPDC